MGGGGFSEHFKEILNDFRINRVTMKAPIDTANNKMVEGSGTAAILI